MGGDPKVHYKRGGGTPKPIINWGGGPQSPQGMGRWTPKAFRNGREPRNPYKNKGGTPKLHRNREGDPKDHQIWGDGPQRPSEMRGGTPKPHRKGGTPPLTELILDLHRQVVGIHNHAVFGGGLHRPQNCQEMTQNGDLGWMVGGGQRDPKGTTPKGPPPRGPKVGGKSP